MRKGFEPGVDSIGDGARQARHHCSSSSVPSRLVSRYRLLTIESRATGKSRVEALPELTCKAPGALPLSERAVRASRLSYASSHQHTTASGTELPLAPIRRFKRARPDHQSKTR